MVSDPIWYRDLSVLARRPREFWPCKYQTAEERVNSLVRLIVYASLATYLYRGQPKFLAFGLAAVAAVSASHALATAQQRRPCCARRPAARGRWMSGTETGTTAATTAATAAATVDNSAASADGVATRPATMGGIKVPHVQPAKAECTKSTPDNPFGNMLLSDLATNPGRAPACKYDDQKDLVRSNFNIGLVRNAYDVYEKENSQRQWMTMPVTTSAPDTIAFAQFCYGNAGRPTCKEDPSRCTGAFP